MTATIELGKSGNSTELIFPKKSISRLNLEQDQWLRVQEILEGGVRLTPYDPGFDSAMEFVDQIMNEDRDTLRVLAK